MSNNLQEVFENLDLNEKRSKKKKIVNQIATIINKNYQQKNTNFIKNNNHYHQNQHQHQNSRTHHPKTASQPTQLSHVQREYLQQQREYLQNLQRQQIEQERRQRQEYHVINIPKAHPLYEIIKCQQLIIHLIVIHKNGHVSSTSKHSSSRKRGLVIYIHFIRTQTHKIRNIDNISYK